MTRTVRSRVLAGMAVGALTATLGLPGVAAAATTPRTASVCALHPLPLPADMVGRAVEVDPTGRFVAGLGYRITDDGWQPLLLLWTVPPLHPRPGVWNEPRLTVVPMAAELSLGGINRYGVVVGTAYVDNVHRPWRYSNGHLEWLPAPTTVSGTWPRGINSRGDIIGQGAVEETETTLPLLWPVDRPGTVEVIDSPPVTAAQEIFDDGTIVGTAGDFGWVRHPDGTTDRLTAPGARWSGVWAAQGTWAVGRIGSSDDREDGTWVRWDLRTGVANAVNLERGTTEDVNARGAVLTGYTVIHGDRLVTLDGAVPDVRLIFGWAIADNGLVVGSTNDSRLRPASWTDC
ncbi:hypothetical protein ACPXB1_18060 [Micromonospora sp. DT68]|uniref:hypothetical protein n=1 Tax=Micromonospora sp. DT68 TaxID=3416522 RepID=UPI003CFABF7C